MDLDLGTSVSYRETDVSVYDIAFRDFTGIFGADSGERLLEGGQWFQLRVW